MEQENTQPLRSFFPEWRRKRHPLQASTEALDSLSQEEEDPDSIYRGFLADESNRQTKEVSPGPPAFLKESSSANAPISMLTTPPTSFPPLISNEMTSSSASMKGTGPTVITIPGSPEGSPTPKNKITTEKTPNRSPIVIDLTRPNAKCSLYFYFTKK